MKLQCKDISNLSILKFLGSNNNHWKCHWDIPFPKCIPQKLRIAKLRMLMRRGLVEGCDCGCRGDWHLTNKGFDYIRNPPAPAQVTAWQMTKGWCLAVAKGYIVPPFGLLPRITWNSSSDEIYEGNTWMPVPEYNTDDIAKVGDWIVTRNGRLIVMSDEMFKELYVETTSWRHTGAVW